MSEPRRSGRPRKAKASSPSPAALGVVKVGPDFQAEFPDGNPVAAELYATLLRAGEAINAEVNRTMIASFGVAAEPPIELNGRRNRPSRSR